VFDFSTHGLLVFKDGVDLKELKAFLATPPCELFTIKKSGIEQFKKEDGREHYSIESKGHSFGFFLPIKIERKSVQTKDDITEQLYSQIFAIWLREIGSDKAVFSRMSPTFTTSKNGRKSAIKRSLDQSFVSSVEDAELAIIGCRNDLFRMGYASDGTRNERRYCDVQSIFRNRQSVETLMARASGVHYKVQLESASKKIEGKQKYLEDMNASDAADDGDESNSSGCENNEDWEW
jgi:hypothetical protein